jgi:hypothetical protein
MMSAPRAGCHVVEPELRMRAELAPSDAVGPMAFVFPMQAGHAYTIAVDFFESGVGGGAGATFTARSRILAGIVRPPSSPFRPKPLHGRAHLK